MYKVKQAIQSKTFWAIVAMFIVNGVTPVRDSVPQQWLPLVDALLALLATYSHLFPTQNYFSDGVINTSDSKTVAPNTE